jgi:exopolyphosphatase/guanosine-5'-triphosphate,3'-diphosphate pyrophosphatase
LLADKTARSRATGRAARWRRIGVVDVGSNSIRLVVYDVRGRAMQPRFNEKVLAGLGRGMNGSGKLNKEGADMAVAALTRFVAITRAQQVDTLIAFATAAVREASDGKAFIDRVNKETGLSLRVLTGGDEARYAAQGVLAGSPGVDGVAGDLGGSSLELARLTKGHYDGGSTYPLGPLALETSSFNEDKVMAKVRDALAKSPELKGGVDTFFAVGGAWRSIATMHMELARAPLHILQNYEIDAKALNELLDELMAGKKHAALLEEVAKRRSSTIPYAAAVLKGVIDFGKVKSVMISAYGVREGVVFDTLDDAERLEDPLDAGIDALVEGDELANEFGRALIDWLGEAGRLTLEPRLAAAACRLVDIGAMHHPDHRADTAFQLVARAPLPGLIHKDRAALALAVANRFKKNAGYEMAKALVDPETEKKARALGALMRLAAEFSGRSAELLKHAVLKVDGKKLELKVAAHYRALISESVERRLQQAAGELGLTAAVVG